MFVIASGTDGLRTQRWRKLDSNCWSRARRATLRRVQLTGNGLVVEAEPLPGAASAECLTAALRRSDVLREGCVDKVRLESSRPTLLSRIIRLSLTYDRTVDAPSSLILKTGLPN